MFNFSKLQTLLVLCTLSLLAYSANASINITNKDTISIALESIAATDYDEQGRLIISSGGTDLNLQSEFGFTLSRDLKYIRFEFENAVLGNTLPPGGINPDANYQSYLELGGAVEDTYAIIRIRSNNDVLARTTLVTLPLDELKVIDINKPVTVSYKLYDTVTDAIYDGPLIFQQDHDFINILPAFGDFYTQSYTTTADFNQQFLRFKPSFRSPNIFQLGDSTDSLASLAQFLPAQLIKGGFLLPNGLTALNDFRDLLPNVDSTSDSASISGDFSIAEVFLHSTFSCSGGVSFELSPENNQSNTVNFSLDQLISTPFLCLATNSTSDQLKRTEFNLDLGFGSEAQRFGQVVYNAAVADLPYITTFSDYRQRVVFTNHTGSDVSYRIEISAEDEALAEAFVEMDAAEGVIPANSSINFTSHDLVSIPEGFKTRVSARAYFDAKSEDVSAAIQILGLGSTEPPVTNILPIKSL